MKQRKIDDKPLNNAWYAKLGRWFKEIPWYGYVFALMIFDVNQAFYALGKVIGQKMAGVYGWGPFGDPTVPNTWQWFGWNPKTAIDNIFPLQIEFWIIPYVSYSIFVTYGALVAAHTGRNRYTQFVLACFASWFIGFLILAFAPSAMNRVAEGVMERMEKDDIWSRIHHTIFIEYGYVDWNLAPSFHCITTGLVMFACFNKKGVNVGLDYFTFVWSILIFFSTQYTKQHYFMDFVVAMAIIVPIYLLLTYLKVGEAIWKKYPKGAKILDRTFSDIHQLSKQRKAKNN